MISGDVIEIFNNFFPGFHGVVSDELTSGDVPGWDSLSHADLVIALEEFSGNSVDITAAFEAKNLGSLLRLFDL